MIDVTLVLCSKNGHRTIAKCLESLANISTAYSLEFILVDNCSTDNTEELMKIFLKSTIYAAKVIKTERSGNSAGRNDALELARGNIIIFVDDDCYPSPTIVDEWIRVFDIHKDIGYASGRILPFSDKSSLIGCNEGTLEFLVPPSFYVERGFIQGSNMAFKADAIRSTCGFDEDFGAGTIFAGEEWELVLRISRNGYAGGYFPNPTVYHDHGRDNSVAENRMKFYDYGAGAVYAKHIAGHLDVKILKMLFKDLYSIRRKPHRFKSVISGFFRYFFRQKRMQ